MAAFPEEEYAQRLAKTRSRMAEAGIDLLLITDPANMNYLTGYDAWSFYVPQAVIVPTNEDVPYWYGRGMDAQSAVLTTTLPRDHILSYADDYVENPARHPFQHLATVLKEHGRAAARIGYEGNAYFFTAKNLQVLTESMPDAKFVDVDLMVNWVRTVKSPREIEVFRQAARIVENVMGVAIDSVNVGTRQCDAAALISEAQIRGTPEFGGDAPANPPSILSAENAA
ncbi:MAG TPA: Xaa-Pro peptidase family protein, partial [Candidatus Acidoferrum sp.]|nr:Xaa-Pro peptidase family protein [Candidatus Acidoferrum sp.]